jgi:hypothetical protein
MFEVVDYGSFFESKIASEASKIVGRRLQQPRRSGAEISSAVDLLEPAEAFNIPVPGIKSASELKAEKYGNDCSWN